ncbi:cysteine synthase family protein [bacterium]|nr:cysteine synthase family protein [bacterium]
MSIAWDSNRAIASNVFETIGRSPLLRLGRITAGSNLELLGKLEYFSPSGSLKDRIYWRMFTDAEERGELKPGMTVLECSTGNAGIACSFIAAAKGYKCIIVMPVGMSEERKKLDIAYGSEMVYTPGGESDVDLALEKVEEIKSQDPGKYWVPGQFSNDANVKAHRLTTGPELWEQTGGKLDAFIATQGTGGTITGVAQFMKEQGSKAKFYAIEPAECPLLSRREWGPHGIEGIGDGFVPRNLHVDLLDGIITTTTDEAVVMAKRLAREEAIFCGISSGSNVAAALKLHAKHPEIRRIVTMINDTGQRYFSTPLCDSPKHFDVPERDHPMDDYTVAELDKYQSDWDLID